MRVRDLQQQVQVNGPRSFLYCRKCGSEYSAHAGDYFQSEPEDVLRCCRRPLVEMMKYVTHEEVGTP